MDSPASVMRYLGPEVGEDDAPVAVAQPRRGQCNRLNVVLDQHVWDEPHLVCTRCGFTREAAR